MNGSRSAAVMSGHNTRITQWGCGDGSCLGACLSAADFPPGPRHHLSQSSPPNQFEAEWMHVPLGARRPRACTGGHYAPLEIDQAMTEMKERGIPAGGRRAA